MKDIASLNSTVLIRVDLGEVDFTTAGGVIVFLQDVYYYLFLNVVTLPELSSS